MRLARSRRRGATRDGHTGQLPGVRHWRRCTQGADFDGIGCCQRGDAIPPGRGPVTVGGGPAEDLDGWLARRAAPGRTYVQDGHDAIGRLDAATHLLYQVRAMLVSQLRADEDERAVRVDRLIAELREERAARSADQPELGAPGRDRSEG